MSELDELEEINLAARREGSALLSRSGLRHYHRIMERNKKRPLWLKELRQHQGNTTKRLNKKP